MALKFTTQRQVRAAFWQAHEGVPNVIKRKIRNYRGNRSMYNTDTRSAFCEFIDNLHRDGHISDSLVSRVTL